MKNIDNEAKAVVKDANISKVSDDVGQAMKNETIAKDIMVDAKSVEKATSKIVDVLKSYMNQLFDHVLETVKEGTRITFTMAENGKKVAIEIADLIKNKISDAAIDFCITGCFTGGTLILSKEGYVKIEEIKIGDYVYSQDVRTGEKAFKEVLQVQKRNTCEFIIINERKKFMYKFIKKIIDNYRITMDDIRMVETEFDITFPEILKNFFLEYNGAEIWLSEVYKNNKRYEIAKLIPIKYGRLPVEKILKWDKEDRIIEEGMIPIASDRGGNTYYFSIKTGNIVLYIVDNIEKPICISFNFDELLENIIIKKINI